jgi:hypothetical protein
MSTRIGSLYHPVNHEAVDIYKGFSWPCLFLGPIWFIAKGLWLWAILSGVLVFITMGVSQLIFPFFANGLFVKKMRKQGYLYEEQLKTGTTVQTTPSPVVNMNPAIPSEATSHMTTQGAVSLVFAKLDDGISWKNEYDIYDANTGTLFSQIREGEVGGLTKVARMGDAATSSKFDVMFSSPSGTPQFRCKNKGFGGSTCDVMTPEGGVLGEIKTEMGLQMKSTITKIGGSSVYKTKGNGVGIMCTKHDITENGSTIGKIDVINESEARTILGNNYAGISSSRKYDFAYHLALESSQENLPLIMSSVYRIAHTTGRA